MVWSFRGLAGAIHATKQGPVQIATKFGPAPWRFTAESVSDATGSLKRLQVERVALTRCIGLSALYEPTDADERSADEGEARQN